MITQNYLRKTYPYLFCQNNTGFPGFLHTFEEDINSNVSLPQFLSTSAGVELEVEMTLATWPLVYLDPSSFKVRTGFHLGSQADERRLGQNSSDQLTYNCWATITHVKLTSLADCSPGRCCFKRK